MQTVYQVPLLLEQQGLVNLLRGALLLDKLTIPPALADKGTERWKLWNKTVLPKQHVERVDIALVGKYVETHDAYLSVVKALEHSAMRCNKALSIKWVDSEHLEDSTQDSDPTKYHQAWHVVRTASGSYPRRVWRTRGRGNDQSSVLDPDEAGSDAGDMSRHASSRD
jgi:CTP synthase